MRLSERVALLHDWLTGLRGGERCLEVLCELFSGAPLFTLLYIPGSVSATIENRRITTSFLQRFPGIEARYRSLLPLFPWGMERFDRGATTSSFRPATLWPRACACHRVSRC